MITNLTCRSVSRCTSPLPFRVPGTYRLRWVIPGPGHDLPWGQSAWVKFTVQQATPQQREAWLQSMLTHVPPGEGQFFFKYLPTLLAAGDDPRINQLLVGLICSPDYGRGDEARLGLSRDFDPASAASATR